MMLIVSLPSHRPIASMVDDFEILSSVPTTPFFHTLRMFKRRR
jgi:hypothetical protein